MLSIILSILKIIGIVLLCIIGFVLLLLLLLLFVPVRYRIDAEKHEEGEKPVCAHAAVTWLLHLVNARVLYPSEELYRVRIAFFKILPRGDKEDKTASKEDNKKKEKEKDTDKEIDGGWDKIDENDFSEASEPKSNENENKIKDGETQKEEKKAQKNPFEKLKDKIISVIENIKFKTDGIYAKIKNVFENIEYYLDIITSDTFERAFELSKKELIRLFEAIKPRKIRGHIDFGAEEPDTTGKVLSVYSAVYPYIGRELSLVPHFDEKVLEGSIYLRGRIRLFTLLVIAVRVYFNKDVKRIIKLFKKENKNG